MQFKVMHLINKLEKNVVLSHSAVPQFPLGLS